MSDAMEPTYILRGIGGSHAHGLATEKSDEDLVGIFSWPTSAFWTLNEPKDSIVQHEPQDAAYHEVRKFCSLASKANPTVLESIHLDSYLEREPSWGSHLIHIRSAFYSERHVLNAFIGYSESQFRKMMSAGNADARSRTPKHATHMLRLMEQGHQLYTTGEMHARVADPDQYREWQTWNTDRLQEEWVKQWGEFIGAKSVLPAEPDYAKINGYLYDYRKAH